MALTSTSERIKKVVLSWDNVVGKPHRFNGTEFCLGSREFGHIHGDYLVDIPFPKKVRDAIVEAGEAEPHHILPETGWVSFYLRQEVDVEQAIALLYESYQIAQKQKSKTIEVEND
jgi:hypothetical protein